MYRKIIKSIAAASAAAIFLMGINSSVSFADYSSQIDELEYEQYLIENEIAELQNELDGFEENARESEEYMRIYDEKMTKKEEEIQTIKMQITTLDAQINKTLARIDKKEKEVDYELEQFRERLRVMYMDGNESLTSVLVGSQDFYDLLIRSELMERISRHDKDMIEELKFDISELEAQKRDLESNKELQLSKKQEAQDNLVELRQIYNDHEETKRYYEAQAEAARSKTAEMRAKEEDVEYELARTIRLQQEENERIAREERQRREREETQREADRNSGYYEDDDDDQSYYSDDDLDYDDTDYTYLSGSADLIWPCPNVWNITDGYGWRSIDEEGGASDFHGGIDINKPDCYGETIVASASGRVITAGDTGNGYGTHVVIDHGGSLSTLYGHMSSCTVSAGDYVSQGQTIGYIGSTGYAYGNHCHFEVRVDGERTDPLNYVDY